MSQHIIRNNATDPDVLFFMQHRDRQAHIRKPRQAEFASEFMSLGDHDMERRRVLLWRVPRNHMLHGNLIKVPFLAFADETISDTDEVLLPILHKIMEEAAREQGVPFGNA